MLERVLDMVKNYAEGAVASRPEIPEEKKQETVQATTDAVMDGLKQNFNSSHLSDLTSLFSGDHKATADSSHPILSNIETTLVHTLVQRVGLSQGVASSLATHIVPSLMNSFTDRIKGPEHTEFNLDSLIGAFSEGNHTDGNGSSILGTLGKMFG